MSRRQRQALDQSHHQIPEPKKTTNRSPPLMVLTAGENDDACPVHIYQPFLPQWNPLMLSHLSTYPPHYLDHPCHMQARLYLPIPSHFRRTSQATCTLTTHIISTTASLLTCVRRRVRRFRLLPKSASEEFKDSFDSTMCHVEQLFYRS